MLQHQNGYLRNNRTYVRDTVYEGWDECTSTKGQHYTRRVSGWEKIHVLNLDIHWQLKLIDRERDWYTCDVYVLFTHHERNCDGHFEIKSQNGIMDKRINSQISRGDFEMKENNIWARTHVELGFCCSEQLQNDCWPGAMPSRVGLNWAFWNDSH